MLNAFRKTLLALGTAGIVAIVLRLQGGEETPPLEGGWRELTGPEFR